MHTKVDIGSENFDLYFYQQANSIPKDKREVLPKEFVTMLWRGDGKINLRHIKKFNILQRLFILWKAAKKNVYIVIQDEENGMNPNQFLAWQNANKKKDYGLKLGEQLKMEIQFALANKEVCDVFNYLNHLSHSPAYNYLSKLKIPIPNPSAQYKKELKYIMRSLVRWESHKKVWDSEFGINMAEAYTLMTLYAEGEMPGSRIYKDIFRRAFMSSPGKIKTGFSSLQNKGLIEKSGQWKGSTMRITALGIDLMNKIVMKYAVNC